MNQVGVLAATLVEGRVFDRRARPGIQDLLGGARLLVSGMGRERAAAGARELLAAGCNRLLSVGVAGGLDRALGLGRVVLATGVVTADGRRLAADAAWRAAVERAWPNASTPSTAIVAGAVAESREVVTTPAQKAALAAQTGAVAVDLETGALAEVAVENGVPWIALRAISDAANEALPGDLLPAIDSLGRPRPMRMAWALMRRPALLRDLLRLGRGAHLALHALVEATAAAGDALRCPDP